jgi:hypothetical protein
MEQKGNCQHATANIWPGAFLNFLCAPEVISAFKKCRVVRLFDVTAQRNSAPAQFCREPFRIFGFAVGEGMVKLVCECPMV